MKWTLAASLSWQPPQSACNWTSDTCCLSLSRVGTLVELVVDTQSWHPELEQHFVLLLGTNHPQQFIHFFLLPSAANFCEKKHPLHFAAAAKYAHKHTTETDVILLSINITSKYVTYNRYYFCPFTASKITYFIKTAMKTEAINNDDNIREKRAAIAKCRRQTDRLWR